ncbi:hepatic lectin-like isoform X2 [Parambassis ranga]|uniref:Hepatic lectin-like isoform X2 n=1 Tax=Parambassis ranga TaxID=210632 RepID=A0A6P7HDE3_9TELE|nr:hepatic lectin-like isoform X2 [Parambassis ranga]
MRNQQQKLNDKTGGISYKVFGQGGFTFPNHRLILLFLGLLNSVLLIAAVAIGINCNKFREGSVQASHSAAAQLLTELNDLRSNHSDVIKAEEEAKKELDMEIKNQAQLKAKIEQLKTANKDYQGQIQALRTEKDNLQSNISTMEGSCGRCLSGWIYFNSTCYFFSYSESMTVKKNWPDSRADCISRGSDLVVIGNPEEQTFVSNSIQNKKTSSQWWENGFWVGVTDKEAEGTWVWINNVTEVERRYWINGEPNNHGSNEDCGAVLYTPTNPWKTRYDGHCHQHMLHWICEIPSS